MGHVDHQAAKMFGCNWVQLDAIECNELMMGDMPAHSPAWLRRYA
jgi:hypothetical protein